VWAPCGLVVDRSSLVPYQSSRSVGISLCLTSRGLLPLSSALVAPAAIAAQGARAAQAPQAAPISLPPPLVGTAIRDRIKEFTNGSNARLVARVHASFAEFLQKRTGKAVAWAPAFHISALLPQEKETKPKPAGGPAPPAPQANGAGEAPKLKTPCKHCGWALPPANHKHADCPLQRNLQQARYLVGGKGAHKGAVAPHTGVPPWAAAPPAEVAAAATMTCNLCGGIGKHESRS